MEKTAHFLIYRGPTWPAPTLLAPYFLTRSGQSKTFGVSNDSWGLGLEGVGGTEHVPPFNGRIDIDLTILGMPNLGVLLCYQKFAANGATFYSKGDLTKLHEWVKTMHGDLMPVGLFIPFEMAWKAVKELMESNGALPRSIAWVVGRDLPPDAFPDPFEGRGQ